MSLHWNLLKKLDEFCPWHTQFINNPPSLSKMLWKPNKDILHFDKITVEYDEKNYLKTLIGYSNNDIIKIEFSGSPTSAQCSFFKNDILEAKITENLVNMSYECSMEFIQDSNYNLQFTITSPSNILTKSTEVSFDVILGNNNWTGILKYGQENIPDFVPDFQNKVEQLGGNAIVSGLHSDLIDKIIIELSLGMSSYQIDSAYDDGALCALGTGLSDIFTLFVTAAYGYTNYLLVSLPEPNYTE